MKKLVLAVGALSATVSTHAADDWVTFVDATASHLTAQPAVGASDPAEKSFAWGDLDHDGDIDLVVARKVPFTGSNSKLPNLLLINQDGVLTDRTAELATASDVPGDLGFATPTSDRDVIVVDVDLDGWHDVVTAAALSDGAPKHVGHPRVYRNLGCNAPCAGEADWRGLRYEDARIPALLTYGGMPGQNPRFSSVSAGDLTGDGYPDLWFSDYDHSGSGFGNEPAGTDFNDRLLVNLGASDPGHFVDATAALTGQLQLPNQSIDFEISDFSPSAALGDFDGDGALDILKVNALNVPHYTAIALNDGSPGAFSRYTPTPFFSTYAVSVADLDRDGKLDIIQTDRGNDRYLVNQGINGPDGLPDFLSYVFGFVYSGTGIPPSDAGLGGENLTADLDRDGWLDVLIADIDVDVAGCGRRLNIYRNRGSSTGGTAGMLVEYTRGTQCAPFFNNPATCIVAGVPASELKGTFDVAVFDIDGDGWLDLVAGRCAGTRVFMNTPPPAAGSVPDGTTSGEMLLVSKGAHGELELTWGASCAENDTDYAVYAAELGSPSSGLAPVACTTLGDTSFSYAAPAASSLYFLVVAHNGEGEGSYGVDSQGHQRPASSSACLPQHVASCD